MKVTIKQEEVAPTEKSEYYTPEELPPGTVLGPSWPGTPGTGPFYIVTENGDATILMESDGTLYTTHKKAQTPQSFFRTRPRYTIEEIILKPVS